MIGIPQSPDETPGIGRGDCLRACLASILEKQMEDLPVEFFSVVSDGWWTRINKWLISNEFVYLINIPVPTEDDPYAYWVGGRYTWPQQGFWIAGVDSFNLKDEVGLPERHAIVMEGNNIAWDPALKNKRTDFDDGSPIHSMMVVVPCNPALGASAR